MNELLKDIVNAVPSELHGHLESSSDHFYLSLSTSGPSFNGLVLVYHTPSTTEIDFDLTANMEIILSQGAFRMDPTSSGIHINLFYRNSELKRFGVFDQLGENYLAAKDGDFDLIKEIANLAVQKKYFEVRSLYAKHLVIGNMDDFDLDKFEVLSTS